MPKIDCCSISATIVAPSPLLLLRLYSIWTTAHAALCFVSVTISTRWKYGFLALLGLMVCTISFGINKLQG
ncbi:hypothetical protein WN943_009420 [Citrus x changshan-huyou]|uniref:Uncharacterized protein n=1 Tax=Citrus unshiu TaxID=55188 RepID=A0A2H5Q0H9_CITUN|nr:hypothetical protein CUMW_184810 [Citrus unshiu]